MTTVTHEQLLGTMPECALVEMAQGKIGSTEWENDILRLFREWVSNAEQYESDGFAQTYDAAADLAIIEAL